MINKALFTVLLAACSLSATAQNAVRTAAQGPLEISADRAELDRDGTMVYSGNVEFTAENLVVHGDRLTLTRSRESGLNVHVTGEPAHIVHTPQDIDDARSVEAEALQIHYHRESATLTLEGKVVLDRDGDRLTGDSLRYDLNDQRILAQSAGADQRVRITITPETIERQTERSLEDPGAADEAPEDGEASATPPDESPAADIPGGDAPRPEAEAPPETVPAPEASEAPTAGDAAADGAPPPEDKPAS